MHQSWNSQLSKMKNTYQGRQMRLTKLWQICLPCWINLFLVVYRITCTMLSEWRWIIYLLFISKMLCSWYITRFTGNLSFFYSYIRFKPSALFILQHLKYKVWQLTTGPCLCRRSHQMLPLVFSLNTFISQETCIYILQWSCHIHVIQFFK